MTTLTAIAVGIGAGIGVYVVTAQRPEAPNIVVVPAQAVHDLPKVTHPADAVSHAIAALLDPRTQVGGAPTGFAGSRPVSSTFAWTQTDAPATTVAAADPAPIAAAPVSAAPPAAVQVASAADDEASEDESWAPPEFPPMPPASPLLRSVPVPMPRPDGFASGSRPQPHRQPSVVADAETSAAPVPTPRPDGRNILERLFAPSRPSGPALAYANPDDGVGMSNPFSASPVTDRYTAVYDISAHTVYLPDGTRLEAHSGLGYRQDDPRFVHDRNVGPTPTTTYELTPREALFHGVPALRLNPVNGGTFGRSGLLAHTYMLGPRGGSNGCVSFRNYYAFLAAFRRGQIHRLTVVAHL